jgi:diguanylate cyclase (GGDEF)-like protein
MRISQVALFETKKQERARIAQGLMKAGLKVSEAEGPEGLRREQAVVIGPSATGSAKLAKAIRAARPDALVLATMKAPGRASWADAVLPLPISANDLRVRLPELMKLREVAANLRRAAEPIAPRPGEGILDPFTGFYTFAHFKEVLFIEVKRARRYNFPVALALVGYDRLPGTMTAVLRAKLFSGLALSIRRSLRDTDFPVQYSPDRVLLLMPHTDLQGALVVSRRICERVARASLQHDAKVLRPTISVGVSAAATPGREFSFADLVRDAQSALDRTLARGGNGVDFETAAGED